MLDTQRITAEGQRPGQVIPNLVRANFEILARLLVPDLHREAGNRQALGIPDRSKNLARVHLGVHGGRPNE